MVKLDVLMYCKAWGSNPAKNHYNFVVAQPLVLILIVWWIIKCFSDIVFWKYKSSNQYSYYEYIVDSEFEKYKMSCVEGNTSLPTNAHIAQKQKDIKYALEYRYKIKCSCYD